MRRAFVRVLVALVIAGPVFAAWGTPIAYQLPPETASLAPGTGRDVAAANCGGCHSADYIATQPRGMADPSAFWTGEVVKMQKAYGAPIADADVANIVAYLVAAYGAAN